MSQQEDFSKPRNLAASLFRDDFGDIELPQESSIKRQGQKHEEGNIRQSKYKDDIDDDFLDINLGLESHIAPKIRQNSNASTSSEKSHPQTIPQSKIVSKVAASKIQRKGQKPKPEKKEVDIDREIGEVAEWGERGAKHNSDEDDFDHDNQPEKVGETAEQAQIRRRLQEKLKAGFGGERKPLGGLKAKAQQLRKQNQQKSKLPEVQKQLLSASSKSSQDPKPVLKSRQSKQQKKLPIAQEQQHNRSSMHLVQPKKPQPARRMQQQEEQQQDIDDHWNKVNSQTVNQMAVVQQKRKQMTLTSVIDYYQKQFTFVENEIDEQAIGVDYRGAPEQPQEEMGCFAALCACFKSDKKEKTIDFNDNMAKRLVAISKKNLSNGQQEFFVLKEIWTRLTGKPFSRYGGHWNQIGFQGRDPATDLRSTGVLSLLQWIQFIQAHPKLSSKYYAWSIEHDYPMALTFIKLTGAFLTLLADGSITASDWQAFQDCFNCLAWGMFGKMMEKYKLADTLGNLVEEQAKEIRKEYKKLLASYNQEFKRAK